MKRQPGRRIESFEIHTTLRPITVEIRFDRKRNIFFASFGTELVENVNLVTLRNELLARGREQETASFTFRPYIEYRLAETKDEIRSDLQPLLGLAFRVVELSDAPADAPRLVRPSAIQLDIDAPAFPISLVTSRRYFPKAGTRIVPYTRERLRVFEEMKASIIRLRERLHEYLVVDADVVGDALDWLHTTQLIPRLLSLSDPGRKLPETSTD